MNNTKVWISDACEERCESEENACMLCLEANDYAGYWDQKGKQMDKVRLEELWEMTPDITKIAYEVLDTLIAKGNYKKVGK